MFVKSFLLLVFFVFFVFFGQTVNAQSLDQALKSQFDIVDIFDGYNDWTGSANGNDCAGWGASPIYSSGGGPSDLIRFHCYWGRDDMNSSPRPKAIQDHGASKRNTGKSIRYSHTGNGDNRENGELSTVKYFFGSNGDETSGYSSMYLFFRMFMSKTAFPTYSWDDGENHSKKCFDYDADGYTIPCYVEGQDYVYLDSWKWIALSAGFINGTDFSNEIRPGGNACRWGINEVIIHIAGGASTNYKKVISLQSRGTFGNRNGNVPLEPFFDKLIGVEVYIKRESTGKAGDGEFAMWFYDQNGVSTQMISSSNLNFMTDVDNHGNFDCWGSYDNLNDPDVNGDPSKLITQQEVDSFKFNNVTFESNKRIGGLNGAGGNNSRGGVMKNVNGVVIAEMQTDWYMDDLIVNDQRIGPKYYEIVNRPKSLDASIQAITD